MKTININLALDSLFVRRFLKKNNSDNNEDVKRYGATTIHAICGDGWRTHKFWANTNSSIAAMRLFIVHMIHSFICVLLLMHILGSVVEYWSVLDNTRLANKFCFAAIEWDLSRQFWTSLMTWNVCITHAHWLLLKARGPTESTWRMKPSAYYIKAWPIGFSATIFTFILLSSSFFKSLTLSFPQEWRTEWVK